MFKSTLFIAVQCFQCSTMQVKQQKKSSNKWTCVVCNQKQSVKKVYAQGYQAKDLRLFVQSFNMSRKAVEDELGSSPGHSVQHSESNHDETTDNTLKRRTDWSQYVSEEDHEGDDAVPAYLKSNSKEGEMHMFEPKVVTEWPEEGRLKKPKLKGKYDSSYSSSSSYGMRGRVVCKSDLSRRDGAKRNCNTLEDIRKTEPRFSREESVWKEYGVASETDQYRNTKRGWQLEQQPDKRTSLAKNSASKWSKYMAKDEDDVVQDDVAPFAADLKLMRRYDGETDVADEKVEDDIHPDFM